MEVIIGNSINDIMSFFNDLTISDDGILLANNCDPNGPGCINFNCYGCPGLC